MNAEPLTETSASGGEPSSLWSRLFNVFAAPGELFEELRDARPAHGNWLVPAILSVLTGILFSVVVFSQPDIVASVAAQQEAGINARVESGKMTQQQADQALEAMRRFQSPTLLKVMGAAGAAIGTAIFLGLIGSLMWILTAKILKGNVSFLKVFEMVGLASMINVLGGILTMLIVLLKGSITAGPNPTLFLGTFDQGNYVHQYLAALSLPTIWYLSIICLGAAKLAGRTFGAAAVWVFGVWLIVRLGLATLSAWWIQFQSKM